VKFKVEILFEDRDGIDAMPDALQYIVKLFLDTLNDKPVIPLSVKVERVE